jgi:hypothetical protein
MPRLRPAVQEIQAQVAHPVREVRAKAKARSLSLGERGLESLAFGRCPNGKISTLF